MEALLDWLVFTGKMAVVGIVIILILSVFFYLLSKSKSSDRLQVDDLNNKFKSLENDLKHLLLTKKQLKVFMKEQKKQLKSDAEAEKSRVFVLDFDGDIKASAVEHLREEITAVLMVGKTGDEVVIRLESPGGMVHAYGLAASQIDRLKKSGLHVTVCVDKVAASGGYLMACLADRIVAAPFAIVGSIGVLAQLPNLNRLLKKLDVDYQEVTAGEYKRSVSVLGPITESGFQHFTQKIAETHTLFKNFVHRARPQVNLSEVANGDHWYGEQALQLKLVDELATSDEYLLKRHKDNAHVLLLRYKVKQTLQAKLAGAMGQSAAILLNKLWKFMLAHGYLA